VNIARGPRKDRNFTILDNTLIRDTGLSFGARGLLGYLLSHPPEARLTIKGLAADNPEGQQRIAAFMRELKAARYVVQESRRDERGRISKVITVFEEPQPENQENRELVNPSPGKPSLGPAESRIHEPIKEEELTTKGLKEGPGDAADAETRTRHTRSQRADQIAKGFCDRYPLSNFHAVRTVTAKALTAGITEPRLVAALRALGDSGSPVSISTLQVELKGGFTRQPDRPYLRPDVQAADQALREEAAQTVSLTDLNAHLGRVTTERHAAELEAIEEQARRNADGRARAKDAMRRRTA